MTEHARREIHAAIETDGYVLYRIFGGPTPDWFYTVGLGRERGAQELVFAGSGGLPGDEMASWLDRLAGEVHSGRQPLSEVIPGALEISQMRPVHRDWVARLLLGAVDYYGTESVAAVQLVPERATIDVPDLSVPYSPRSEPAWRWLTEPWEYRVAEDTIVLSDLDALRGKPVTVVNHNQDGELEWEFYSTEEQTADELLRVVPLGTLIATDPALADVLELDAGAWAQRRSPADPWEAYWM